MATKDPYGAKIKKAKNLGKDTKVTSLSVPTGDKAYVDNSSKEYKALNASGRIKKTITGGNKAFSTGVQRYSKSELAAAKLLISRGEKPTARKIAALGNSIMNDRSKTATRAKIVEMNRKQKAAPKKKK